MYYPIGKTVVDLNIGKNLFIDLMMCVIELISFHWLYTSNLLAVEWIDWVYFINRFMCKSWKRLDLLHFDFSSTQFVLRSRSEG